LPFFVGCLYWQWLPFWVCFTQPSFSSIFIISLVFTFIIHTIHTNARRKLNAYLIHFQEFTIINIFPETASQTASVLGVILLILISGLATFARPHLSHKSIKIVWFNYNNLLGGEIRSGKSRVILLEKSISIKRKVFVELAEKIYRRIVGRFSACAVANHFSGMSTLAPNGWYRGLSCYKIICEIL
jgi:hypothetical protein